MTALKNMFRENSKDHFFLKAKNNQKAKTNQQKQNKNKQKNPKQIQAIVMYLFSLPTHLTFPGN